MRVVSEGLFFHPDGSEPSDVLNRMLDGTVNPRLDSPFAPAFAETREARERIVDQISRTEGRLAMLRGMLARMDERLAAQEAAEVTFAETGEIDPILVPSCVTIAKAEVDKQAHKVKDETAFVLPDELVKAGWSQKSVHVTDNDIIVTIRKTRTDAPVTVEETAKAVVEKIKIAMQPFQVDGAHFRVLRDRIATRPQQPKGPPDD